MALPLQECNSEHVPDTESKDDPVRQLQFTQEEPLSDVALVVEGQRLYTSKSLLAFASPVFKCMFTSQFKERDQNEVKLPGKDVKTIDEMLRFLHPAMDEELLYGQDSAFRLLPVADEYQLFKLTSRCEHTLYDILMQRDSLEEDQDFVITCLQTSARYGLEMLLNGVVQKCTRSAVLVKNIRENQELSLEIKFKILEKRVDILENEYSSYKLMKEQTAALRHRLKAIIVRHEDHCRCRAELKLRTNIQGQCSYCSRNWCSDHVSTEAYRNSYWYICNHRIGYTVSNDGLVRSFINAKVEH